MRIKFQPKNHISEMVHMRSTVLEKLYDSISVWHSGQIKNIPDDLQFRERINGETHYVRLVDDLLSDRSFVLADTDKNPNFICVKCGNDTYTEFLPSYIPGIEKGITVENQAGQRLCVKCFKQRK